PGLAPGVNGDESIGQCRCNVHWTTVHADRELRPSDQPNELQDAGVIKEIQAVLGYRHFPFASTNQDHASWGKRTAKLFHREVVQRFSLAASEWMKEDEWFVFIESGNRIAGGEGEMQWPTNREAECFDKGEITIHGMGVPIDRGTVLIKKMCPLTGIAHSVKCFRVTHLADQGTAEEALEIEGDIWPDASDFAEPRKQMLREAKAPEISAG